VNTHVTHRFDGFAGVVTGAVGIAVLGYGLLLVPTSLLGGLWIAAIGGCLLAAVLVGSAWGRRRLGLGPGSGTSAAMGFIAMGLVLAALFVAVNYASFGGSFVESGSSSGSESLAVRL